MAAPADVVDLAAALDAVTEHWSPRIVAELNDVQVKAVKVQGEFVWHSHAETDELFLVQAGRLEIDLPDRTVELGPGELFVVPAGVRHRPRADEECSLLLIEPAGTLNTGDAADREGTAGRWLEPGSGSE